MTSPMVAFSFILEPAGAPIFLKESDLSASLALLPLGLESSPSPSASPTRRRTPDPRVVKSTDPGGREVHELGAKPLCTVYSAQLHSAGALGVHCRPHANRSPGWH